MKREVEELPTLPSSFLKSNANVLDAYIKEKSAKMSVVQNTGIFSLKTVNQTIMDAAKRPQPRKLWYELWHEGELCFLYADQNLGKSIYSVQIADEISKTEKVLLFDFELSDKQFQIRYSDDTGGNPYPFSDNLIRIEINSDGDFEDDMEKQINDDMERVVQSAGAKVIVVDNLTYLTVETEKSKSALPLMKRLKKLKNKYGLSILCIAHTPKRDISRPITGNDLAGSKTLINICDSAFAIGLSARDKSIRYVKQIKVRNCEKKFDTDNVILYEIIKENGNFVKFQFIGFGDEREHLREPCESSKEELIEKVRGLSEQGKTQRQIADELGISVGAANKYLKKSKKRTPHEHR